MVTNLVCVGTDRDTEGSTQSKVSNFYSSLVIDEKVLWFEITMNDTTCVHEHNALQDLVGVALEKEREKERES